MTSVLTTSMHIMQTRIARSRLAGEPADVLISPRLAHLGADGLSTARAEAIPEGAAAVKRMLPAIEYALDRHERTARIACAQVVGAAHVLTERRRCRTLSSPTGAAATRGAALAVVRPGSTAEVAEVVRLCAQAGVAIVPQGGNTGLCGGAHAARRRGGGQPDAPEPHARGRHRQQHHHRRGRLHAGRGAGSGCGGGSPVPAVAGGRRHRDDRRQPVHQRRRRAGAALRQRARTLSRASKWCCPTAASGTACAVCARTTPATT